MNRATYAISSIFFSSGDSGNSRLHTSYFLSVMTAAVLRTAYRPYWSRPVSAPFSDFGSTIGNDAGMNLLHEFAPELHQLVRSHSPKFATRMEAQRHD